MPQLNIKWDKKNVFVCVCMFSHRDIDMQHLHFSCKLLEYEFLSFLRKNNFLSFNLENGQQYYTQILIKWFQFWKQPLIRQVRNK